MNKFTSLSLATLVAAVGVFAAAPALAEPSGTSTAVQGQKIDSGLGDLPHYRLWTDKTGKNPLGRVVADRVAGEKQDSGLGDLPHYRLWADKSGRVGQQLSQAK